MATTQIIYFEVLIPSLVIVLKEVKAGSTIYADLAEPIALLCGIIMPPKIQLLQH
jgi:hypothetical protein